MYNQLGFIKITDFGFSTQLTVEKDIRSTIVGTPSFMAPEIINGQGYDEKVDIWSIGILAFELAEKQVPVEGKNKIEVLAMVINQPSPTLKEPSRWSVDFHDFIGKCFEKIPSQRPSSKELLKHRFFESGSKEAFLSLLESFSVVQD